MQIIVHGKNTQVPKRLKEHATEKLAKVERFMDRIQTLEIEFSEEHNPRLADNKFSVEVTATTKKHVIRAHASAADPMAAVDAVEDKLEVQVRRLKSKFTRRGSRLRSKRGADLRAVPDMREMPLPDARNGSEAPISSEEVDERSGPVISKVTRFSVKPMTAEEAVLQLEALDRDFYLFVDAESEQAGVVYRRGDGSFGLIEPE